MSPLLLLDFASTPFEGERPGVGGGESSTLRLSDLALRLLAASAFCARTSCFCFSRSSFSRLFLAAAPRSFVPFLPSNTLSPSGEGLFDASVLLEPVRCLLFEGRRLSKTLALYHFASGNLLFAVITTPFT